MLAALVCLLAGCRRSAPPAAAIEAVSDTTTQEGVQLVVTAKPRAPRVGEAVTVELSAEAPRGYEIRFPGEDALGELEARLTPDPEPRPGATGVVWRRTLSFEPAAAGPLEIPSLTVICRRPPTAAETQPVVERELVSGPLKLDVQSNLAADDSITNPRDITGTLLPPAKPWPWWVWAAVVTGALGAAALVCAAARALVRRANRPPPPVLPEVWALRALEALAATDWLGSGRAREFYYRLTEIVRVYIERKFGLAAAEMTTEEFLAALARDRRALPCDAVRLGVFLEACDFVKYAALRPRREDADAVLGTARAFIHATAAAGAAPSGAAGGQAA